MKTAPHGDPLPAAGGDDPARLSFTPRPGHAYAIGEGERRVVLVFDRPPRPTRGRYPLRCVVHAPRAAPIVHHRPAAADPARDGEDRCD